MTPEEQNKLDLLVSVLSAMQNQNTELLEKQGLTWHQFISMKEQLAEFIPDEGIKFRGCITTTEPEPIYAYKEADRKLIGYKKVIHCRSIKEE